MPFPPLAKIKSKSISRLYSASCVQFIIELRLACAEVLFNIGGYCVGERLPVDDVSGNDSNKSKRQLRSALLLHI